VPLAASFVALDRAAIIGAAHVVLGFYRSLAPGLAAAHGLAYPTALDRVVSARLPLV
jgi:hypothetical protein